MRFFFAVAVVLVQGCAASRTLRSGATVSVQTASGTSSGELFAVDDERLWLCDGRREVAQVERASVTGANVSTAGTETTTTSTLAPDQWTTWARWARHPEGPPTSTGRCVLTHEDPPPSVIEVALNAREHVTGVLLEATAERLVLRFGEGQRCFDPAQLVSARLRVERVVRDDPKLVLRPSMILPIDLVLLTAAALLFKEMTTEPGRQHVYVPIDLSHVTALRALAKYPAGAPTDLCPR